MCSIITKPTDENQLRNAQVGFLASIVGINPTESSLLIGRRIFIEHKGSPVSVEIIKIENSIIFGILNDSDGMKIVRTSYNLVFDKRKAGIDKLVATGRKLNSLLSLFILKNTENLHINRGMQLKEKSANSPQASVNLYLEYLISNAKFQLIESGHTCKAALDTLPAENSKGLFCGTCER